MKYLYHELVNAQVSSRPSAVTPGTAIAIAIVGTALVTAGLSLLAY